MNIVCYVLGVFLIGFSICTNTGNTCVTGCVSVHSSPHVTLPVLGYSCAGGVLLVATSFFAYLAIPRYKQYTNEHYALPGVLMFGSLGFYCLHRAARLCKNDECALSEDRTENNAWQVFKAAGALSDIVRGFDNLLSALRNIR